MASFLMIGCGCSKRATASDMVAVGDVARWRHDGYGETIRIEHWTNAADQGEAAGRALLEGDAAPVYAPTPYFWSDQHGLKIQFVGETRPGDTVTLLEGDPDEERFVVAYGRRMADWSRRWACAGRRG